MKSISDKRRSKGERLGWNSTIAVKPYTLKRTPIRKISKKAMHLWQECRERVFDKWGKRCFLCNRKAEETILDCHHLYGRTGEGAKHKYNEDYIFPLCSRDTGCKAHRHTGKDKVFYDLFNAITEKVNMLRNECKRINFLEINQMEVNRPISDNSY